MNQTKKLLHFSLSDVLYL